MLYEILYISKDAIARVNTDRPDDEYKLNHRLSNYIITNSHSTHDLKTLLNTISEKVRGPTFSIDN